MKPRRLFAAALVVLGAVLMFAAPAAEIPIGAVVILVGIGIELAGIGLERRQ